jgi:hypothetical protein
MDYSSRFGTTGKTTDSRGTYNRRNQDEMFKVFFKTAAKTAAKGAANEFSYRTRRSFYSSPSMAIIMVCTVLFFLDVISGRFLSSLFALRPIAILAMPWTLITHMFMHASFSHLFFNMMVLFFFGRELERRIGNPMFLYVYVISGIFAALGYSLTASYPSIPLVGASGAIMGIFATLTVLAPELPVYVLFFPMRIKHALILFAVLDFLMMGTSDMVAHTAHLSGVAVGLYMGMRIKGMKLKQKQRRYGG